MAQIIGYPGAYAVGDTSQRDTVQKLPLGSVGYDADGKEYRYVRAGAAIAANDAVRFQGSALGFDDVRPTSAVQQSVVGVALAAFASGDYGWVLRRGVGSVKTTGAVAVGTTLATGATAGTLAAAAATDVNDVGATVLVNSASPQVCFIQGV